MTPPNLVHIPLHLWCWRHTALHWWRCRNDGQANKRVKCSALEDHFTASTRSIGRLLCQCEMKFYLDRKWPVPTTPTPLEFLRKFIYFGDCSPPLVSEMQWWFISRPPFVVVGGVSVWNEIIFLGKFIHFCECSPPSNSEMKCSGGSFHGLHP